MRKTKLLPLSGRLPRQGGLVTVCLPSSLPCHRKVDQTAVVLKSRANIVDNISKFFGISVGGAALQAAQGRGRLRSRHIVIAVVVA